MKGTDKKRQLRWLGHVQRKTLEQQNGHYIGSLSKNKPTSPFIWKDTVWRVISKRRLYQEIQTEYTGRNGL